MLMINRSKIGYRELVRWKIDQQHQNQSIGCDAFDPPVLWQSARTSIVCADPRVERGRGIDLITAFKGVRRRPSAAALLAAHANWNFVLCQIGHQLRCRISSIKKQYIIRPHALQHLKQHLALGTISAMNIGLQHQFSARQVQSKLALRNFGVEPLGEIWAIAGICTEGGLSTSSHNRMNLLEELRRIRRAHKQIRNLNQDMVAG